MIGTKTIDQVALELGMQPRYSGIGGITIGPTASLCTGTLVSSTMVLTAAHCFDVNKDGASDYKPEQVKFLYGNELGANLSSPTAPSIDASAIHLNPLYVHEESLAYQIYDLALLTLSSAVPAEFKPFSVYASPGGNVARVVGYGSSGPGGSVQDNRKRAGVNAAYIPDGAPFTFVDFDGIVDDKPVADPGTGPRDGQAASSKLEAGLCYGDSGGPLLTMGDFMLSGVVTGSFVPVAAACTVGDVVGFVRTGIEGNSDFLHAHGIKVIDEPGTLALLGTALLALFAAVRGARRSA
ncbi:trypsin-like serine protease [Elioraea rosea]|uniref:trypsin-like serine protease n=1 Tax=Elioraea rosea TaxID=2492390 RepID=UPI001315A82F|nr:trypsin-like serine protease [Elioraea rosea]